MRNESIRRKLIDRKRAEPQGKAATGEPSARKNAGATPKMKGAAGVAACGKQE